uniref:Centromere protein W n=1 Tax=Panagrellus redivivus TaxID=6233 RepID=A0A7E4ZQH5_PANRE
MAKPRTKKVRFNPNLKSSSFILRALRENNLKYKKMRKRAVKKLAAATELFIYELLMSVSTECRADGITKCKAKHLDQAIPHVLFNR